MSTDYPETPDETPTGDVDTPSLEETGTEVPAETGTASGGTEPTEAEQAFLAERAELASTPAPELDENSTRAEVRAAPITTELDGKQVEVDHDTLVTLRSLPTAQTATDPQGTERIVVPDLNVSGWKPAPVEPDPVEVARLERRQAALAAQDAARVRALGLTPQ